ncbi:MAG: hypothetical protein JWO00_320 [Candidatus Parcubacteria bacterium]|nr:hypothetical protein [Candidatus Parcubacteria bacterium]
MKTKIQNLNDALIIKLKALYDIEKELTKALPKMAKKATDEDLKAAFEEHLKETEVHVERIEECFELLDLKPAKVKVEAIRGLVADTEWIVQEKPGKEVLDSMLIASASYVEHYEMAGYTSASKWARMLDYTQVADLLDETLQEEEGAADKLAGLADSVIDERAMGMDMEEDDLPVDAKSAGGGD